MKTNPVTAICIYHKGSYDNPRECYIDGCWNKEDEKDYLTEIEFPVKKK